MDEEMTPSVCKEASESEDNDNKISEGFTEETDTNNSRSENVSDPGITMSKNQRKRLLKHQRYLEGKKIRKLKRKEKRRELQEKKRNESEKAEQQSGQPMRKKRRMESTSASPVRVAIDLSFDDLMAEHDIKKLVKQVQRCYAANRRAEHPLQLYLTSFGGQSQEKLDATGGHYRSWDVHVRSETLTEVFTKEDIVYLTSDSPNVLETLDMTKVYVIGGLVDHNHHKGICYRQAVEKGLGHAQLPVGEYVKLNCRKVLTVNHVFEILVRFVETQDWKDAFFEVLPARKVVGEAEKKVKVGKSEVCDASNTKEPLNETETSSTNLKSKSIRTSNLCL